MRIAALGLLVLAAHAPAGAADIDSLGEKVAVGYIQPAFHQFQVRTQALSEALDTFCSHPGAAASAAVAEGFGAAVSAWSRVSFLRFGPLVQSNRFERIAFWPDPRGLGPRQIEALIKGADPAALADAGLRERSVAVQGLAALEYVLYGEPALLAAAAPPAYTCGYAQAIGRNLGGLAGELSQAWRTDGAYGAQFVAPGSNREFYRSPQEVAAETVKALSSGLQFVRDVHLGPVLGDSAAQARPRRAAFWRSGLTQRSLADMLAGMRTFLEAAGTPAGPHDWIAPQIIDELGRARSALAQAQALGSIESALADPQGYRLLTLARLTVSNAKSLLDQDLAPALGVVIGFNAFDGD